jgi:hypothetical protein
MIKGGGDNMGITKDMDVIGQGREETWRENPWRIMQSVEMSKCKKRPYKRVALVCAHKRKNDKKPSKEEWWLKNKGTWKL